MRELEDVYQYPPETFSDKEDTVVVFVYRPVLEQEERRRREERLNQTAGSMLAGEKNDCFCP